MVHEVKLPQMGESVAQGTIVAWLKKVGDKVNRDEPLFEMSTDKVDAEIPSPATGVLLEIRASPGATIAVNTVVAIIGEHGEVVSETPGRATTPDAPTPTTPLSSSHPRKASPVARNVALARGIKLSTLAGTGFGGIITKQDVLAATQRQQPSGPGEEEHPVPPAYRSRILDGDRVEELSIMRQKIAVHMVVSRQVSAHVQTLWEVDYGRVAAFREQHKDRWAREHGVPLTYTAFVMKAAVSALKAYPIVNASLDGTRVIFHQQINLGLAVPLDQGLIVPVVRNAAELSLLGLAQKTADLTERARTRKLTPDDVQAGTFTIIDPGSLGALASFPIINQPQVAILSLGVVEKRPVVIDDAVAIRPRGYLSLSFDHRLIDAAIADHFMAEIKAGLEAFTTVES